ncbi:MAG: NAD(P)H-binding protein [Sediminibacterium sp.]|nr:MAG: putative NADH-flavin [Chitinophagaceae bacterium]MDP1842455.1 NAD(P)H-binding protein [Sediminibacterium sp.]TXT34138.1 MAG: putative NADH-flavin reductase [Chitinophagaceae bacterium]
MHITIFGATGQVGKRLVQQGLIRGYTITAFGRTVESLIDEDNRNEKLIAMKGYIFDQKDIVKALENADAVISVLGGSIDGSDKSRSLGIKNIITVMQQKGIKRIVALGGMGVLNAEDDTYLINNPDYPEEYKLVGMEHLKAYEYLRDSTLDWTFFCPPYIVDEAETGYFITRENYVPIPNEYKINSGDLAMSMLNAISKAEFIKSRVGISKS